MMFVCLAGNYARVSTGGQQSIPFEIRALREYAARRGWAAARQVKEIGSGASARELREQIVEAARRHDIEGVLVWRLDRWGRSVRDLLAGQRLGRPATAALHAGEDRKLHQDGVSQAGIAHPLQIGRTSVRRILTTYFSQK